MKIKKSEKIILTKVKLADSFWKRAIGLLGHKILLDGEGLLFRKSMQMHTFFMRFAIDIIFLDKDFKIIKIYHSLKPFKFTGFHFAIHNGFVLEAKAGFSLENNLAVGDFLILEAF